MIHRELKKLLKSEKNYWKDKIQELVQSKALNSRIMLATPHNVEVGEVVFEVLETDMRELVQHIFMVGMEIGYKGAVKDVKAQGIENIE